MQLPVLAGDRAPPAAPSVALLAKGFRPFFLAAALYALVGVPLWVATLLGAPLPHTPASPLSWHAHEMVFGFTGAVFAGFLLTAVSRWTDRDTLQGAPLAALCAVWLTARVLPFVPGASGVTAALFDVAFWLGLLAACARPIVATRNRRNYGFLVLLGAFTLAAALSHANRLGYVLGDFWSVHSLGVDLVTVGILVMTGRIVPSFTRGAVPAARPTETPRHDRAAVAAMLLVVILDAASAPAAWSAAPAAVAGVLALSRARHWGAAHTLRTPLLWILHLGHAWVGVGLVLRGIAAVHPGVPPSIALHALTAGGIGLLTFGMMTRVTLGHTGRMLAVPPAVTAAMLALSACALLRVLGPLIAPGRLALVLGLAGALWAAAFAVFLLVYGRALIAPRIDGRPG